MVGAGLIAYLHDDCPLFERALAGEDVVAPLGVSRDAPPPPSTLLAHGPSR